ncbi:hypothetical protein AAES_15684 [Amazona aestiva]|uniref:Uncharacterized protein n=1 Tax=Amazona aestiva TaxID=12930 RepID=A0A0Q3X8L7_AMAAE|nr:hypothetical protein AAES_15684 [Amazona aestiva]
MHSESELDSDEAIFTWPDHEKGKLLRSQNGSLRNVFLSGWLSVVVVPATLYTLGFTAGGIAAGSVAAKLMSAAAIANGGGVAAGSLVAIGQSLGGGAVVEATLTLRRPACRSGARWRPGGRLCTGLYGNRHRRRLHCCQNDVSSCHSQRRGRSCRQHRGRAAVHRSCRFVSWYQNRADISPGPIRCSNWCQVVQGEGDASRTVTLLYIPQKCSSRNMITLKLDLQHLFHIEDQTELRVGIGLDRELDSGIV